MYRYNLHHGRLTTPNFGAKPQNFPPAKTNNLYNNLLLYRLVNIPLNDSLSISIHIYLPVNMEHARSLQVFVITVMYIA